MGYPTDLDERTDEELQAELDRRAKARKKGLCTYCGRKTTTPACRFPEQHTNRTPLHEKQIGDTLYTFTSAFCEGAMAYFASLPYDNPYEYDEDAEDDRHQEWDDGNGNASEGTVTEKEIKAAMKVAKRRMA